MSWNEQIRAKKSDMAACAQERVTGTSTGLPQELSDLVKSQVSRMTGVKDGDIVRLDTHGHYDSMYLSVTRFELSLDVEVSVPTPRPPPPVAAAQKEPAPAAA